MTVAVFVLLLGLAGLPGAGPPYEAKPVFPAGMGAQAAVRGMVVADWDGDGADELLTGVATGLLIFAWRDGAAASPAQMNLPPRYFRPGGYVYVGAPADADGDGRPEAIVTARTPDGFDQRLWILDPLRERILLDVALPTGPDLRKDGQWDGYHDVAATLPGPDGPLVVLVRRVGYDRLSRGLVAYRIADGSRAWSYPMAGSPASTAVGDVDGDGRPELVAGVGSGGNLRPGEEVDGRLDDRSWVRVLTAAGRLLWERPVAGRSADPQPVLGDLDGDGAVEVVVVTRARNGEDAERVTVFAGATGDTLASALPGAPALGLCAWPDGPAGGVVVCATDQARILRYRYRDGALAAERTVQMDAAVAEIRALDLLPMPGPELVVRLQDRRTVLLTGDLVVAAELPAWTPHGTPQVAWTTLDGRFLVYQNELSAGLRLVPTPLLRRIGAPTAAGTLLLGAVLAGGTYLRQRRRLGRLRRTSRLDLLRAFLTSRHGTVGPVGALDRVMWAVDNPAPDGAARLAAAWSACRTEALPDLEALLEKAAHVRLDPPLLAIVRRELAVLGRSLDGLAGMAADDHRRPGLVAAARTSLGLVGDGIRSLGATLAASCRLDPVPLVREVAARHAARRPAVAVAVTVSAAAAGRHVHADRADLEFAVDNLLDNAARQLADRPDARIEVRVDAVADRLAIEVTDNGPGVPDADRERIFAAGTTTKAQGGGLGLWHSRQALRYYGGDLLLADAPAGGGARFTVVLRAAAG